MPGVRQIAPLETARLPIASVIKEAIGLSHLVTLKALQAHLGRDTTAQA